MFRNRGATMSNSVKKGIAMLWLKSSQLKLCFCFGKKVPNTEKGCDWSRVSEGFSRMLSDHQPLQHGPPGQARPSGLFRAGHSAPLASPPSPGPLDHPPGLMRGLSPRSHVHPRVSPAESHGVSSFIEHGGLRATRTVAPKSFADPYAPWENGLAIKAMRRPGSGSVPTHYWLGHSPVCRMEKTGRFSTTVLFVSVNEMLRLKYWVHRAWTIRTRKKQKPIPFKYPRNVVPLLPAQQTHHSKWVQQMLRELVIAFDIYYSLVLQKHSDKGVMSKSHSTEYKYICSLEVLVLEIIFFKLGKVYLQLC